MTYRFANYAGRAVLVDGDSYHDLEQLSDGKVSSDPMKAIAMEDLLHELQTKAQGRLPSGKIDPSQFGAPSPCPEKAFGIGLNYQTHADESSMEVPSKPVVFAKFSSCICEPNATVELRGESVDYEGEIVVVIGKGGRDIASVHAWEHVFGVTVGQDISDRAVQMASNPPHFDLGKSFDTFGPIGPVIVSPDALSNRDAIPIKCLVNGEERQNDTSEHLIFDIPFLIEYLSHITTLKTGDLIFTGTPAGVGVMQGKLLRHGDVITTVVEGVGTMTNTCVMIPSQL